MKNEHIQLIPAHPDLAGAVADYYRRNRVFLQPSDPIRREEFYTEDFQRQLLTEAVQARQEGRSCRFFIVPVCEPDKIIGFVALNNIVWGAFRSCFLGYALDRDWLRRGYMTGAVALAADYAFRCLGLHRIEANVMPRNGASMGVLEKNGFQNEGLARAYLNINGVWEDHIHMVKLNDDLAPAPVPFTARPYEPGDYEFVYELKKLCYHDYVEALWGWNEADQRARFDRFINEDGDGERMYLLLRDGQTIGMTNYEFSGPDTLDICNICLLPDCRGKGIGTALLGQYIAQSTRPVLTLQVYKNNPARRLYERLGFRTYEETETHYRMKLTKEA